MEYKMASQKLCFVISPIGDDGTPVRQEADALLWIIRQALEKYDFGVTRVDEIARSAVITNEIVQLIQESALAIIVLTGHNPNVFYEAGRRHETGKPFIQMIRRGEPLPFDVAGIKTIMYDNVDSLSAAARTIDDIQKYVDEFEKSGYGTTGSGISLATIASVLDRIERRLSESPIYSRSGQPQVEGLAEPLAMLGNPREAFMGAVATGNVQRATAMLPRLEEILQPVELVAAAGMLCSAGVQQGADALMRLLENHLDKLLTTDDDGDEFGPLRVTMSSVVRFHAVRHLETEGLARLQPWFDRILTLKMQDSTRAFFLNQMEMLFYGAGELAKSAEISEQVRTLAPTETAYMYNASLTYERLGVAHKVIEMVDMYMAANSDDASHLSHAVEVYVDAKETDKARSAYALLRKANPEKAAMLLMKKSIRQVLGAGAQG
jgi:hypothetical protein